MGVIIFQVEDAISQATIYVVRQWKMYSSIGERFRSFVSIVKQKLGKIREHVSQIKDAALSGLTGGFLSAVINTVINAFVTTSGNLAKVLNDSLVSLIQAGKIIFLPNSQISMHEKLKQATKLIVTAIMASTSVLLGDALGKVIAANFPFLAPISNLLGSTISAIISGALTALFVYVIDNLGQVFAKVKDTFNTFMIGLTVSPVTIKNNYMKALAKIDGLYKELLQDIYERYAETQRLQQLAYDMSLPTANQFVNSVDLARHVGVDENRIVKSNSDVTNFFNS